MRTIVIDPGHGGAKPGAIGSKISEKALVLSIAKKVGKLISDNYPDVKVIYTRTTDVDISLAERAHIANRNKADLFISIHANSHPTSSPTGVETFVMGLSESRANLAVAQKENADILLEADYKENADYKDFDPNSPESYVMLTMYQNAFIDKSLNFAQAIQNQYKQNLKTINRGVKQAELYVLYKTTCPSVLTEVGFISNPDEEAFMMSDEGQAKIAISIFNAFMNYKAIEEGTNKIANPKIDIPGAPKTTGAKQKADEKKPTVAEDKKPAEQKKPAVTEDKKPAEQKKPAEDKKPAEETKVVAADTKMVDDTRPVPSTELVSAPSTQKTTTAPSAPSSKNSHLTEFYTVQFLTANEELKAGATEFKGLTDVMVARNGKLYCYSVGRFATFADANAYCKKLQNETPFKDAWTLRRTSDQVQNLEGPQNNQNTQSNQNTQKTQKASATPTASGTTYRIQIFTSKKIYKAGDPELQGIKDFHYEKYGKVYLYTVGDYATIEEARKRCADIRATSSFKDAFVVGFKNGKTFKLEK